MSPLDSGVVALRMSIKNSREGVPPSFMASSCREPASYCAVRATPVKGWLPTCEFFHPVRSVRDLAWRGPRPTGGRRSAHPPDRDETRAAVQTGLPGQRSPNAESADSYRPVDAVRNSGRTPPLAYGIGCENRIRCMEILHRSRRPIGD